MAFQLLCLEASLSHLPQAASEVMGTTCAFSGTGGQSWPEPGMEEKGRELVLCPPPPPPTPVLGKRARLDRRRLETVKPHWLSTKSRSPQHCLARLSQDPHLSAHLPVHSCLVPGTLPGGSNLLACLCLSVCLSLTPILCMLMWLFETCMCVLARGDPRSASRDLS